MARHCPVILSATIPLMLNLLIFGCLGDDFNLMSNDDDNEVASRGAALPHMFGLFNAPSDADVEALRKPQPIDINDDSLPDRSSYGAPGGSMASLTVRSCTPDVMPWIGQTGFCVPTGLLKSYCNVLEASRSVDDCAGTPGNWCCYKPSPTPPPIVSTGIKSLVVKSCTPDTHPWVGRQGFCATTDQLNTYCTSTEISASVNDCPGMENWCCYKTSPPPALVVRPCTPDALSYLGRTGFCASTDQLNGYCPQLEISVAVGDCANYAGNWCCYTPHPRPTTLPPTTVRPLSTTSKPATVAYPNSICMSYPNLPQCQPVTTPQSLPYYYGATPVYLPCSKYSYLSECTTTIRPPPVVPLSPEYGMRRMVAPPLQFPIGDVVARTN